MSRGIVGFIVLTALAVTAGCGNDSEATAYVVCNLALTHNGQGESQRLVLNVTSGFEEQSWESDVGVRARLSRSGQQVNFTLTTPERELADETFSVSADPRGVEFGPTVQANTADLDQLGDLQYGCVTWPTKDNNYGLDA